MKNNFVFKSNYKMKPSNCRCIMIGDKSMPIKNDLRMKRCCNHESKYQKTNIIKKQLYSLCPRSLNLSEFHVNLTIFRRKVWCKSTVRNIFLIILFLSIQHSEHDDDRNYNDIAEVTLAKSPQLSARIQPIPKIASGKQSFTGFSTCYAVGYGAIGLEGK